MGFFRFAEEVGFPGDGNWALAEKNHVHFRQIFQPFHISIFFFIAFLIIYKRTCANFAFASSPLAFLRNISFDFCWVCSIFRNVFCWAVLNVGKSNFVLNENCQLWFVSLFFVCYCCSCCWLIKLVCVLILPRCACEREIYYDTFMCCRLQFRSLLIPRYMSGSRRFFFTATVPSQSGNRTFILEA